MSVYIGVIAEDSSDVDVVDELIKKMHVRKKYSIKKFLGHGSGKIRGKCIQWAGNLRTRGCSILIVVHDLDEYVLSDLESHFRTELVNCPIPKHIVVIPIREIEAWLLSDNLAIKKALNLKENIAPIANPQLEIDPKRKLRDLIYIKSGKTKRYVNTSDNRKIASELDLEKVRICPSFLPLESFVQKNLN
jgi:hypothetical protein